MSGASAVTSWKLRLWRAGLVAISFLLSLLLVEVVFRILDPPEPVFIREHPHFGFAHIPSKQGYWQRETESPVLVEINSQGLRDVERPYQRPPGAVRVMMLGDSMVAAFNTPFEQIASRQLEVLLRDSLDYDGIEVINAGTQSWGTAQELIFFREEGVRYDPDLVVLHFFAGNDFVNNYVGTAAPTKPSFSVEGEELRLHQPKRSPAMIFLRDHVLAKSAIARTIRRSSLFQGQRMTQGAARLGLVATDGGTIANEERAAQMLEITSLLIDRLAAEVERTGARFIVYLIRPGTELWEHLPPELRPDRHSEPREDELRRWLVGELVTFLEARGISHIDAWERMVRDSREGKLLFVGGRSGHWSPEGNRRVAEDVHRAILPLVRDLVEQRSNGGEPDSPAH